MDDMNSRVYFSCFCILFTFHNSRKDNYNIIFIIYISAQFSPLITFMNHNSLLFNVFLELNGHLNPYSLENHPQNAIIYNYHEVGSSPFPPGAVCILQRFATSLTFKTQG